MNKKNTFWYAVYTKPRWEKKVAALFTEKGIENYCPLNKVIKQWSDRKKMVLEPLFKSYVFVRVAEKEKWAVTAVSGVLNYVYWLGKPATIKDEEIITIKKFLKEFTDVQVEQCRGLQVNTAVRVKQGVLMNYQGILVEVTGNKAKVKIESMGLNLFAQFETSNLEALIP
ncbi:MAG TPA: UpxY family transcription antiterminator [Ferruginibacter sp.]|nr:UpxY family transcription antiterminator [Ferruginibacter sp.]HMP21270.1 UpxY family transcription antiterminator [Ferruginibacter sp.]